MIEGLDGATRSALLAEQLQERDNHRLLPRRLASSVGRVERLYLGVRSFARQLWISIVCSGDTALPATGPSIASILSPLSDGRG
jgi:hypothetical protein